MSRPFQTLDSAGTLTFDGLQAVCWFVHMKSDVTQARVINISPGQLYTFVFQQDNAGRHRMVWPVNCQNAAPIDLAPNSTTVQNFIGNNNATMIANIPSARTP
jgi:hypothetical protein